METANGNTKKQPKRDIEKIYPTRQLVNKLRRLADYVENGQQFKIQVAGQGITIHVIAVFTIGHELDNSSEELEFQLK